MDPENETPLDTTVVDSEDGEVTVALMGTLIEAILQGNEEGLPDGSRDTR